MVHHGASSKGPGRLGTRGNKDAFRSFMAKQLRSARAGIYPPAFFSLGPVHLFLPGDGGAARRGNNNNNNNNNNTMALPMGPVPSIAARELPLIRSGIPPLSDI